MWGFGMNVYFSSEHPRRDVNRWQWISSTWEGSGQQNSFSLLLVFLLFSWKHQLGKWVTALPNWRQWWQGWYELFSHFFSFFRSIRVYRTSPPRISLPTSHAYESPRIRLTDLNRELPILPVSPTSHTPPLDRISRISTLTWERESSTNTVFTHKAAVPEHEMGRWI